MSRALLAVIAFALAACGQPAPQQTEAPAAAPSTWTDPSGRVTLTIPGDWREYDAASAPAGALGSELAIFAPSVEGAIAQCEVSIDTMETPAPATRELLNEATSQFRDGPEMQAYRARANVQRADLTDLNGVRVLDVRASTDVLSRFERRFFFATNGVLELYTIACSAAADNQAGRLGANAVANSLQIRDS